MHTHNLNILFAANIIMHLPATSFTLNSYSGSTVYDQIDNVRCTGAELRLTNCPHNIANLESYRSPRVECPPSKCVLKQNIEDAYKYNIDVFVVITIDR